MNWYLYVSMVCDIPLPLPHLFTRDIMELGAKINIISIKPNDQCKKQNSVSVQSNHHTIGQIKPVQISVLQYCYGPLHTSHKHV